MRGISPIMLELKDAKANATFLQEQKACDVLMQPKTFTRTVDGNVMTWEAILMRDVLTQLKAIRHFIKYHESRELGVLANVPWTLDRLLLELDATREPGLSWHDDAKGFAAQVAGRIKARFWDSRPHRALNGSVHAAQLFDASTCGDLLEWFSPTLRAARVASDPAAAVLGERIATARLLEARGVSEVLIDHFVFRVREEEARTRATAAALDAGESPSEYVDEDEAMDLEAHERRIAAQASARYSAVLQPPLAQQKPP
jgi:hypothetical protein